MTLHTDPRPQQADVVKAIASRSGPTLSGTP